MQLSLLAAHYLNALSTTAHTHIANSINKFKWIIIIHTVYRANGKAS